MSSRRMHNKHCCDHWLSNRIKPIVPIDRPTDRSRTRNNSGTRKCMNVEVKKTHTHSLDDVVYSRNDIKLKIKINPAHPVDTRRRNTKQFGKLEMLDAVCAYAHCTTHTVNNELKVSIPMCHFSSNFLVKCGSTEFWHDKWQHGCVCVCVWVSDWMMC